MPSFRLPTFKMPFPTRINPHCEAVRARTRQWATATGLVSGEAALHYLDRADFTGLFARAYPTASEERLWLIDIFNLFIFVFDDQFDDARLGHDVGLSHNILDRFHYLLALDWRDYPPPANAVERAWHDYWGRIQECASPDWQQRFLSPLVGLLHAIAHQIDYRVHRRIPDLFAYLEMRRNSVGIYAEIPFIELANQAPVPAAFRHSQLGQALAQAMNDVIWLTNDIFSYSKEIAFGEVNNGVLVCQHLLQGSVQEAVDLLNTFIDSRIEAFLHAREEVPGVLAKLGMSATERDAIRLYVQGMEDWMSANLAWSLSTSRYLESKPVSPEGPADWIENVLNIDETQLAAPTA